jgi:hypothetical protein
MTDTTLIGKRVENEYGQVGVIRALAAGGQFVMVEYSHGYYEYSVETTFIVLTMRVSDLEPIGGAA